MRLITPDHNRRQEIALLEGELKALRAERDELREALNSLVDAVQTRAGTIPDAMRNARAILSRTEPK